MGSPPFKDIFRMAIIPSGPRLAIIEEHEGIVRGEPVITDEDFADVVDAAIARLRRLVTASNLIRSVSRQIGSRADLKRSLRLSRAVHAGTVAAVSAVGAFV